MSGARKKSRPSRTTAAGPSETSYGSIRPPGMVRRVAASLPLILLVALLLRTAFAWDYVQQNSHQALAVLPFLQESGNIAASLATGDGFSSPFRIDTGPTAWMPPVYPWLLSELFRVFGVRTYEAFLAALALNILASAFTCLPIYFAGKRVGGIGVAAGAAWLWVFFPNAILNTFQSMWDASLGGLLGSTILCATLTIERSERLRSWFAYGVLWAVSLLTNATLASLLPLLLCWLAYRRWKQGRTMMTVPVATGAKLRDALAKPALAAAIAVLCCIPWTIRNYSVFGHVVMLRSNLGLQLWLGNNENARESWREQLHPIFNAGERALYIRMGEINYMRLKEREAFGYMLSNPGEDLKLIGKRFVATWSGGTPSPLSDFIHTPGVWFRSVLIFNLFLALGAVAGIVVLYKKRTPDLFPVAAFPIVFPCAYYLTLSYPRYRLPIDPALMLLTAVAVKAIFVRRARS
jgi:4-amino-4-deoxy-L-arabinose transferase-like glycosyltransferase